MLAIQKANYNVHATAPGDKAFIASAESGCPLALHQARAHGGDRSERAFR